MKFQNSIHYTDISNLSENKNVSKSFLFGKISKGHTKSAV